MLRLRALSLVNKTTRLESKFIPTQDDEFSLPNYGCLTIVGGSSPLVQKSIPGFEFPPLDVASEEMSFLLSIIKSLQPYETQTQKSQDLPPLSH